MTILEISICFIFAHALCDYPLQGDFLAKAKNHKAPIPGVDWWIALSMHAAIHAGAVAFITRSVWLGVAEFAAHCFIDFGKCDGWFGFRTDQALHLLCKVIWVVWLAWFGAPASVLV